MNKLAWLPLLAFAAVGFGQTTIPSEFEKDRIPTLKTGGSVLIRNGKVYTITKGTLENADVLIVNGKIAQVGKDITAPAGVTVIDATGLHVLPGIIDAHSHRGQDDTNEGSDVITAETNIRDGLNPTQVGLFHYLAGGITTALGLHGSANPIGGQSVVFKPRYLGTPESLIFEGAPPMIKFALGENVKRAFNNQSIRFPRTRMGVEAVFRRAFDDAIAYQAEWDNYRRGSGPKPRKDMRLEVLSDVLNRKIWVQCHSYRQDEMLMIARLSQEYGFKIASLQHAMEGYKIAPELAKAGIPASIFAEYWSYKLEVYDTIPMCASIMIRAGMTTSVNTDTFQGLAPLNLDAGKAMRYGISEADALKTITINPAIQLGVEKMVGSIEVGKHGDISIWRGHPLSVYSRCMTTLIEGEVMYQRRDAFGIDKSSKVSDVVQTTNLTSDLKPLPKVGSRFAIVGGTVHPVSGPEIAGGVVVIRDGKIESVGRSVPSGVATIDAKGMHVYPGFIDAGSILGMNEIGPIAASVDSGERSQYEPDLKALLGMNPESEHIPIARSFGITSTMIRPNGGIISGQGAMINTAGYNREDMAVSPIGQPLKDPIAHQVLSINFDLTPPGALARTADAERELSAKRTQEAILRIREQFDAATRYAAWRSSNPGGKVDTKLEALVPYAKGLRPVVFQTNDAGSILAVLKLSKELGLKPIIGGGADAWMVADQLKAAGVPVLYSPAPVSNADTTNGNAEYDPWDTQLVTPALLHRAGVKFAFQSGTSAMAFNLPQQVGFSVGFGLSHEQGIRALTLDAAQILGFGDVLGSLEPGKMANVIVTTGDPLELTTHVQIAIINGKPANLQNRFTRLYRKYEARLKP